MKVLSAFAVRLACLPVACLAALLLTGNAQAQSVPNLEVRSLDQKYVIAHWVIEAETEATRFFVERSADGEQFETVGVVDSDIAGGAQFHYSFLDETPLPGASYYRLRVTPNQSEVVYTVSMPVRLGELPTGYVPAQQLDPVLLSVSAKSPKATVNKP